MPIAKLKPESRSPKLPQIPEIEPPKYKSVVIDEKNIPCIGVQYVETTIGNIKNFIKKVG